MNAMDLNFLFIMELFNDFNFILKIFVMMALVNFVRVHISNSAIAIMVTIVAGWFIFFQLWPLFGTIYLLFSILLIGIAQILTDFFFVLPQAGAQQEPSGPVSSGADVASRRKQIQSAQAGAATQALRRIRGR